MKRKPAKPATPITKRSPWRTAPSVDAGLPTDRDAWLAIVLPVIRAAQTHPEVSAALAALGYTVGRQQVARWHASLESMIARGELALDPLPRRVSGGTSQREAVLARWRRAKGDATGEDATDETAKTPSV